MARKKVVKKSSGRAPRDELLSNDNYHIKSINSLTTHCARLEAKINALEAAICPRVAARLTALERRAAADTVSAPKNKVYELVAAAMERKIYTLAYALWSRAADRGWNRDWGKSREYFMEEARWITQAANL